VTEMHYKYCTNKITVKLHFIIKWQCSTEQNFFWHLR